MDELSDRVLRINLVMAFDESYSLVLDTDFPKIAADLRKRDITKKFGLITDTKVGSFYAKELQTALKSKGLDSSALSRAAIAN